MAKTVLAVDDDADYLAQLEIQLLAAGFEVLTADNVGQAKEILDQRRPDLAVVDLMMEHMDDGFTLCHDIKARDASIPVILVTGVAGETGLDFDASTKEERSWIKADALLDKPVRFEQLRREIGKLLKE